MLKMYSFDDSQNVHLPLFTLAAIAKSHDVNANRGAFSVGMRQSGDMLAQPTQVTIKGALRGQTHEDCIGQRDALYPWFADNRYRWLERSGRRYLIGAMTKSSETWQDKSQESILIYEASFMLILPHELSANKISVAQVLVEGANTVALTHVGNVDSYPVMTITGAGVTGVDLSIGSRALRWRGLSALGSGSLVVDCMFGEVLANGVSALADVLDDSRFLHLPSGGVSLGITLIGGGGSVAVEYREHYTL